MQLINEVQKSINKITFFLEPLLPLANSHMVDFFTKDVYKHNIIEEIREEIELVSHAEVIKNIFNNNLGSTPHLQKHFEDSENLTLYKCKDICMTLEEYQIKLKELGCTDIDKYKLEVFMSPKKSHEVEILASVCSAVHKISNATHIIDIGDGKGYLSSFLSLRYNIPVLGIDASSVNSEGALKRIEKLEKVWHNLSKEPKKSVLKKIEEKKVNFESVLYKQLTAYIDQYSDINGAISKLFDCTNPKIGLVGLHTCGNLASSCINIFNSNDNVLSLSNVGCCYHLIEEKFENSNENNIDHGFPLSDFLLNKKCLIGRNARMVAAQSMNRIMQDQSLPNISIFYRALLQVILEQKCCILSKKTVGKLRKPCKNFVEYARLCFKKLEIEIDISDEEIMNYFEKYENRLTELHIFHLIRSTISPVIESLIMLDRLLFLLEQGHERSFLVQLFDPVVSPRCYGLISIK